MIGAAERKDPLLGTALLFVASRTANGCVEIVRIERLFEGFRFHHMRMQRRPRSDRIYASCNALPIDVHDQLHPEGANGSVAKSDHLVEFPGCVHVQQRKWGGGRM